MTKPPVRRFLPKFVAACAATSLLFASPMMARGEDDKSVALALFEQGRSLIASGEYEKAAVKFEGAAKILHTFGILFNLASCYEKLGRTASAWSTWREAGSVARAARKGDDEARAAEHERALAPTLSQLTVVVPAAAQLPDLEVARNGAPVPRAAWDTPLPVDPGEQTVEVRASGHRVRHLAIVVQPNGDKKTLTLEPLEPDPSAAPITPAPQGPDTVAAPAAAPPDAPKSSSRPVVGWVTAGVGAGVAIAGVVVWRLGQGKMDDAVSQANGAIASNDRAAYQAASDDHSSGEARRTVGFVLLGVGGAAAITGAALALTAPKVREPGSAVLHVGRRSPTAELTVGPWLGWNTTGVVCGGRW
jgi:hypothetical protein